MYVTIHPFQDDGTEMIRVSITGKKFMERTKFFSTLNAAISVEYRKYTVRDILLIQEWTPIVVLCAIANGFSCMMKVEGGEHLLHSVQPTVRDEDFRCAVGLFMEELTKDRDQMPNMALSRIITSYRIILKNTNTSELFKVWYPFLDHFFLGKVSSLQLKLPSPLEDLQVSEEEGLHSQTQHRTIKVKWGEYEWGVRINGKKENTQGCLYTYDLLTGEYLRNIEKVIPTIPKPEEPITTHRCVDIAGELVDKCIVENVHLGTALSSTSISEARESMFPSSMRAVMKRAPYLLTYSMDVFHMGVLNQLNHQDRVTTTSKHRGYPVGAVFPGMYTRFSSTKNVPALVRFVIAYKIAVALSNYEEDRILETDFIEYMAPLLQGMRDVPMEEFPLAAIYLEEKVTFVSVERYIYNLPLHTLLRMTTATFLQEVEKGMHLLMENISHANQLRQMHQGRLMRWIAYLTAKRDRNPTKRQAVLLRILFSLQDIEQHCFCLPLLEEFSEEFLLETEYTGTLLTYVSEQGVSTVPSSVQEVSIEDLDQDDLLVQLLTGGLEVGRMGVLKE